jgi:hypothetical protein
MAMQSAGGGAYNPTITKPKPGATTTLPNGTKVPLNNVTSPTTAAMAESGAAHSGPTGTPASSLSASFQSPPQPAPAPAHTLNAANPAYNFQPAPQPAPVNNAPPGEGFGPQFGEQYGMSHVGQYDQPTMLETFAQQQMNGNNPYYDRLRQQGMDAINQQMAARGHFNSGGALSSLGNFAGALGAAQFQDMGNLLGSASSMGLNRMGQGNTMAAGVQQLQQNRIQGQWGNLSDLAHLGAGNVGGFYGQGGQMSGDAAMSGINAGANAAGLTGQGQRATTNTAFDLLKSGLSSG